MENKVENKQDYTTPSVQVFTIRFEGVICQSIPGYMDGGDVPFID